ncbi:ABC transporter permease [Nocardioides okcheonensis]|uniref:ABC transporter permease n=1 Tax=Nocardioides okcheonensis TaxID=2894081 RepID=UPI001E64D3FD|nr:ABC transporter permease [Nocardioides okcheonensis]UFN45103.1 ABC transporter permease [Nocardioides okcheonensis]
MSAVPTETRSGTSEATLLAAAAETVRNGYVLTGRNMRHVARIPGRITTGLVQPIMFVVLFAFVFGGSLGGEDYRRFLMAGIFAQSMVFNASFTTVGLANDLQKGIVERFRSLPMSPLAVILGRTVSDMVVGVATLVVTALCGLLVGWRVEGSAGDALVAFGVLVLFGFAMSWVGATVGVFARTVEVAQSAGLIWLFPLSLISTAFVSAENMPTPLREFAAWNPVSAVATSVRDLLGNPTPASLPQPDAWSLQHPTLYAVLSSLAVLAVFMPLVLARYRRLTRG